MRERPGYGAVGQIGEKNEEAERKAVLNAGGFYISRYEAGKEHWWIKELKEKEAAEALKWFEEQNKIAKFAEKERIIIQSFQKEIREKREKIEKLYTEIKDLEKKCNECLAKISVGDTGLMDLLAEENSKK
jgi:hypothetical protein